MEEGSEITREAIFEVIENQIRENNPPITKETYKVGGSRTRRNDEAHRMCIIRRTFRNNEK